MDYKNEYLILDIYYLDKLITIKKNMKEMKKLRELINESLCKFEPKVVKKLFGNKCVKVIYRCKYCNFLSPNPVLTMCNRINIEPKCICINNGLLCNIHDLRGVSKVDKPCDFSFSRIVDKNNYVICMNCDFEVDEESIKGISLVCKFSGNFENEDFYGSNEFIHRFDSNQWSVFRLYFGVSFFNLGVFQS